VVASRMLMCLIVLLLYFSFCAILAEMTGLCSAQACSLVAARPAILTRSSRAVSGSWRALSPWRLPHAMKVRLIEEHPLLLRLSSQELHGR
jgi:hypothetical protein